MLLLLPQQPTRVLRCGGEKGRGQRRVERDGGGGVLRPKQSLTLLLLIMMIMKMLVMMILILLVLPRESRQVQGPNPAFLQDSSRWRCRQKVSKLLQAPPSNKTLQDSFARQTTRNTFSRAQDRQLKHWLTHTHTNTRARASRRER